jgi:hypothetical protein
MGLNGQVHVLAAFPKRRDPDTQGKGGRVGTRIGPAVVDIKEFRRTCREWKSDFLVTPPPYRPSSLPSILTPTPTQSIYLALILNYVP